MAEVLSIISIISFVLSGICILLGAFFFIKFKIPSVIGDLSHRTAKKSIAKMRDYNEKTGVKFYKSSETNANRGKLTDTMSSPKKVEKKKDTAKSVTGNNPETGLLTDNKAENREQQQTELLNDSNETEKLDKNETDLLLNNQAVKKDEPNKKVIFIMLDDVELIHTDEVI